MSKIKEVLKAFGAKNDFIDKLLADEPQEGFDPLAEVEQIQKDVIDIHIQKNPPDITDKIQSARAAATKDLKYSIAKSLGIVKTRTELEQTENTEFLKLITDTHNEAVKNGTTDEKLKLEVNQYREKMLAAIEELDEYKAVSETKIQEAEKKSIQQVREFKVNQLMDSYFQKVPWGINKEAIPDVIEGYKYKIAKMGWTINEDGSLSGPDGQGKAIDFEGKHHFTTLEDAIKVISFPSTQKSNGNGSAPGPVGAGFIPSDPKTKVVVDDYMDQFAKK